MSLLTRPDFELPDLRIVDVDRLVPHEQHDDSRSLPLVDALRKAGVLKNPPIVTPLAPHDPNERRFVVLDGANRSTAARLANLPHILVQVVRYDDPGVRLTTWHHALVSYPDDAVEKLLSGMPGLVQHSDDPLHARATLARREAFAIIETGSRCFTLHGAGDVRQQNELLNRVVDSYRGRTRFHRVVSEFLADAQEHFPSVTALVVFPHFQRAEILELAMSGARLPAGITRHLIPWRALRVNVPIEQLADPGRSAEAKTEWLREWLQEKVLARSVRFYEESTVLFDE
jgi:hypothetical protein